VVKKNKASPLYLSALVAIIHQTKQIAIIIHNKMLKSPFIIDQIILALQATKG
jgi:hypothetical protein